MALISATCKDCGKRFGWQGELADKPSCPRCGWQDDPAELAKVEAVMKKLEEELLKDAPDQ